jgi:hypothetical protein
MEAARLRDLSEALFTLHQSRLIADHLRWTFEKGEIRCLTLPGGTLAALLVTPEAADSKEVEDLLADLARTAT